MSWNYFKIYCLDELLMDFHYISNTTCKIFHLLVETGRLSWWLYCLIIPEAKVPTVSKGSHNDSLQCLIHDKAVSHYDNFFLSLLQWCPNAICTSTVHDDGLWDQKPLHIEAKTKWPPISWWHFQMRFPEWKYKNFNWHRPGDMPLSEPIMVSLQKHICVTRS